MSVRIVDVCEVTKPISSPIRNAYIDFTKMTTSLVAVVTDAKRDGKRVVGYGFNSNGRYGQGGLIRERFAPRLMEADPESLLNEAGDNLDPDKVWAAMMSNEKPGGHGERSVAVGTIDMAVWDAVAKIAGQPLFRLLAERHKRTANPRVFVYAAGGYYYPGKGLSMLRGEMRGYLDRGYNVVKMKIGGAPIEEDRKRIEACSRRSARTHSLRSTPTAALIWKPRSPMPGCCATIPCSGTRKPAIPSTTRCRPLWPNSIPRRWRPARTCSVIRTRGI
jgi:L-alanine-DL-glutamate epimerase-like enolase superfamily enzyme